MIMIGTRTTEESSCHRLRRLGAGLAFLGIACGGVSCTAEQAAMMGGTLGSLAGRVGAPSMAVSAISAVTMAVVAKYQADEQQLAQARAKAAKVDSSSKRKYVKVSPPKDSPSKGKTHVIAYDPGTKKMGNEVLVLDESVSSGQSVSIAGREGEIL